MKYCNNKCLYNHCDACPNEPVIGYESGVVQEDVIDGVPLTLLKEALNHCISDDVRYKLSRLIKEKQ